MANGIPLNNHTRFIVACVTVLGVLCILAGGVLTWRGYNAELLIGGGVAAISGLLGVISNRQPSTPPDVTISGQPPKVEVTQPIAVENKT